MLGRPFKIRVRKGENNVRLPGQKTYRKKCPDGTDRVVYYNVDDAFPLYTRDWTASFGAVLTQSQALDGGVSAELSRQLSGWLVELDEANRSMQTKFRTAYVNYQTEPCSGLERFNRRIEEIDKAESELRKIEIEFRGAVGLLNAGASEETVHKLVSRILGQIPTAEPESEIDEFHRAQAESQKWMASS